MKPIAQMAELVDAQVSGICAARRGGSSPLLGTILLFYHCKLLFLFYYFSGAGDRVQGAGKECSLTVLLLQFFNDLFCQPPAIC